MITTIPSSPVTTIDFPHKKVHEGRYFSGGYYNSALANSSSIDILIQNTTQYTNLKIAVSAGGDAVLYIYEDATFSNAGTAVAMDNHNRASTKTFAGTVTHTPTLTGTGTQLNSSALLPGGDKHTNGAETGFASEYILDASTVYLVRLTNVSGGATKASVIIEGYQPTL